MKASLKLLFLYLVLGQGQILGVISMTTTTANSGLENEVSPDQLRAHLLENYDTKVLPPTEKNPETGETINTRVGVDLTLNYFTLEEVEHVFLVNAWMRMTWTDRRLAFNSSNNSGKFLHFGDKEIWQPDLILYNSAYPTEIDHYGDTHLLVSPDGSVMWVPPARLAAHCSLTLTYWPYDTHTCELKFGSWTFNGEELDIYHAGSTNTTEKEVTIDYSQFVKNSEWKLLGSTVRRNVAFYTCCPEPYVDLTFEFNFQRVSPTYTFCLVLPIIIISMVNTLLFLLPPTSGERVTVSSMNMVLISLFLLYFLAKLPPLGDHIPLLVLLYSWTLILVSISFLLSILILKLSKRSSRVSRPPSWSLALCNLNFPSLAGLGHAAPFAHSRLDEGVEMRDRIPSSTSTQARNSSNNSWNSVNGTIGDIKDDQGGSLSGNAYSSNGANEWLKVASMIDCICFIVFALVHSILIGTLLL